MWATFDKDIRFADIRRCIDSNFLRWSDVDSGICGCDHWNIAQSCIAAANGIFSRDTALDDLIVAAAAHAKAEQRQGENNLKPTVRNHKGQRCNRRTQFDTVYAFCRAVASSG